VSDDDEMVDAIAHLAKTVPVPALVNSCPFCPHLPRVDDYLLPTFTDDRWTMRRAHRYCMLVEVVGQDQADVAWGERTRPGD
jgi:hypothetical protein